MASELYVETLKGLTSGANANKVIIPSGQTLYAPGHVLQVVHERSELNQQFDSGTFVTTGLTATITPVSTTSKILITYGVGFDVVTNESLLSTIYRDSTNIADSVGLSYTHSVSGRILMSHRGEILDSPSTTNSVTYSVRVLNYNEPVTLRGDLSPHSITLMEIAG